MTMTEPTVLRWETLTKRKFDQLERDNCVVLVTCSPLEVHGPHLPFGADALEGEGLSRRMLHFLPERHRRKTFLQLPFIYTATDTLPHPGSLFFQPSTTQAVLRDLGRTLAAQGFRDILVSNFHGSPRHFLAIEEACAKVSRERGIRMVCIFSVLLKRLTGGSAELYDVLGQLPGVHREDLVGDTHGGLVETSQLLALHPEWVERDYASLPRRTIDTWLAERGEAPPPLERGKPAGIMTMIRAFRGGLRFFRAETYAGAPGSASPELGERILDRLGEKGAEAVAEILDGVLAPSEWHSPLWKQRFWFTNPMMVRFFNWALGVSKGVA
ncbi:MAG TPA: creatininase family protein [Candidatus Dormibacteraeota bacterium]|nr:creatininase family protein [Candidatus Dormibacteraeota bacterium]